MENHLENSLELPLSADAGRGPKPCPIEAEVVALFDLHRPRLLRYLATYRALSAQDGEEIVQEAFLALFRHLRMGKPRENLPAWLSRVANNLALKRVQRLRKETDVSADWAVDPAANPEDALAQDQIQRRWDAILRALPEQDRRCLALRADGLKYREIAKVLDISLGSVAKSIERSLGKMVQVAGRRPE